MIAYCWPSGLIGLEKKLPVGALPIASGSAGNLAHLIVMTATLAHDNHTWRVPGFGMTETEEERLDAILEYIKWVNKLTRRAS